MSQLVLLVVGKHKVTISLIQTLQIILQGDKALKSCFGNLKYVRHDQMERVKV